MKKQNMQDERVVTQRRKINSEACGILMIVLLASIVIQQFLFDAPLRQYAVEAICFFGISFYILVRSLISGINVFGDGKPAKGLPWMNIFVTGITITFINGIVNYTRYADSYSGNLRFFIGGLLVTFVSATAGAFLVFLALKFFNDKKQAKIQRRLDEEENIH